MEPQTAHVSITIHTKYILQRDFDLINVLSDVTIVYISFERHFVVYVSIAKFRNSVRLYTIFLKSVISWPSLSKFSTRILKMKFEIVSKIVLIFHAFNLKYLKFITTCLSRFDDLIRYRRYNIYTIFATIYHGYLIKRKN